MGSGSVGSSQPPPAYFQGVQTPNPRIYDPVKLHVFVPSTPFILAGKVPPPPAPTFSETDTPLWAYRTDVAGEYWRRRLESCWVMGPCIYRGFVFLIQFGIDENGKRNHTSVFFQLPHSTRNVINGLQTYFCIPCCLLCLVECGNCKNGSMVSFSVFIDTELNEKNKSAVYTRTLLLLLLLYRESSERRWAVARNGARISRARALACLRRTRNEALCRCRPYSAVLSPRKMRRD